MYRIHVAFLSSDVRIDTWNLKSQFICEEFETWKDTPMDFFLLLFGFLSIFWFNPLTPKWDTVKLQMLSWNYEEMFWDFCHVLFPSDSEQH